ncbi:hypothetical protein JADG_008211 [Aureobasidium aubasidani]|nr:hypothetical protein JADG_008208 [Aureobasidium pullulans]KAG2168472.1 hypothetical protein JADG_008211 [Aureobasidium pullulans]
MTTIKRTTRSSKWPYTSHFEDALLTIKKRNRIEAVNARILKNYRDALNARAIIEAAEYVERITKMAQFNLIRLNIIVHFDEHDKLSGGGLRSNPPEYSNYHLPSEDSMTEEQKYFSEHYPLHVYFKVDKLRVPTLEEAIREYELAEAALFAHQEETSLVSEQIQALLGRCHAAKALIPHPRSWAERAYIPGAMRTTE